MENVTTKNKDNTALNNKITIDNRNRIIISGISQMLNSNETLICMMVEKTKLTVSGKDLHIEKLDVDCGTLEASGTIDSIKYAGGSEKFFKRLFK